MSSKKCIYKNCRNTGAGEITLFSFPKDPTRQNLWLQLAGRSGHTLQNRDSLCERHFASCYISTNQRRKVLVGVSVPFAFDQIENEDHEDEQQIEALEECERLDINEMFGGDDEQQEEIDDYSSNSAMGNVEHVTIDDYSPETIVCDRDEYGLRENKRKIIDHSSQNGSSKPVKLIKIDLNKSKPKNGTEATNTKTQYTKGDVKPCTPTIIEHPDVSIFNIRGEEFIQMPKSVYLEEKSKLERSHMEYYAQEIDKLRSEVHEYKNFVLLLQNGMKKLPS